MGRIFDKLLKSTLSVILVFSSLMLVTPMKMMDVQAAETNYEIYPTPHQVTYATGSFIMRKEINVVYEKGIDQATKTHLETVLKSKDKTVTVGTEKVTGKTNILVGIKDSGEYVDTYAKGKYTNDLFTDKHFGAYYLSTINDEVVIIGRDSDAAFYGITTLKQIFQQVDGTELRHLTMEDYADVNIRGFIEGYYGIPWSNQDRMELMKFGGDIKMTSYIFAPKNDPYHKELWREPYPEKELAQLKEMVDVGNATKCRFVWTAHPFMGGFNAAKADEEIQALINKFEHLYNDANVRQFGVLGDDVGSLDKSIVVKMMQEVGKWAASKPDVKDVVFCPGGYNHAWQGDYSELNTYDQGFPSNIQIFWTGEAVCQPIEQNTLEHFRRHNSEHHGERRAPLFWLNWPVNDINHGRMIMGDGSSMLKTDIKIDDLAGAVTNPMQESEPSKAAIFQVADYAWNVKDFNGNQTWKDSFKYIDAQAGKELYELAKHMANPQPNGHGLVMPESVELAPMLTEYKNALKAGHVSAELANKVEAEFKKIIQACDDFNAKSQNDEMKKDLAPFIASLKDLSTANINFIHAEQNLAAKDTLAAFDYYTAGQEALKASATHTKPMLGGETKIVDPGSTELIPFAKTLEETLSKPMSDYIAGEDNVKLEIKPSSSYTSIYEGSLDKILDGNDESHVWFAEGEKKGAYVQLDFNIPQTVYGVHLLNGTKSNNDTFEIGELKYKVEGSNEWKSLGEFKNRAKKIDVKSIQLENVVAIRYECKQAGDKWVAMREFKVAFEPEIEESFTQTPLPLVEGWSIYSGNVKDMTDGNASTAVHFNVRQNNQEHPNTYLENDYFGVNFDQTILLGQINIIQDNEKDKFHASKLQYLDENDTWTDLPDATFGDVAHITFDASKLNIKAKGVRLVATNSQENWVKVYEFDVDSKVFFNSKAYTNVESLKDLGANIKSDTFELASKQDITLKPNEFLGIALDRIHEIQNIDVKVPEGLTLEVGMNEHQFTEYKKAKAASVNARYIRLINKTSNEVTFDLEGFNAISKEFYEKSFIQEMSTFTPHDDKNPANLFDGDWTTQACFGANQYAGMKFVYDLGQTIEISKLKVVLRDSEHDFPRHAKISVSEDGKTWHDVMVLGNQDKDNPGEAEDKDEIGFVLPTHEISYNTKEKSFEAKTARYIQFEITRNKAGSNKWVRLQELIINDGAYYPTVNNPTFESDSSDTHGGEYANLVDSNLKTYFIPNKDSGSLTYHVSNNNNVNVIKVVQAKSPISHATVTATLLVDGKEKVEPLGTLSQTVNEFALPKDAIVLNVKIVWKDVVPNIAELILSKNEKVTLGDNQALKELLAKKEDTTTWTKNTADAYIQAIVNGQHVVDSMKVSQETIDGAINAIETAIANKAIKGDIAVLQNKLDTQITDSKAYSVASWCEYQFAINALKLAIKEAENTSEADVTRLVSEYDDALKGLVYNALKAEEATLAVEDMDQLVSSLNENDYSIETWNVFNTARAALKATLEENKTNKVHPDEIVKKLNDMNTSFNGLVNVSALKQEIAIFEDTDAKIYTEDSYQAYTAIINQAKQLLANGTKEAVEKALKDIHTAKNGLVLIENYDNAHKLLNHLKSLKAEDFTTESFKALQTTLKEVEKLGHINDLSEAQLKEVMAKLQNASDALVYVKALKASMAAAKSYDEQYFTVNSYKVLSDALVHAESLLVNGLQAEVDAHVNVVDEAIRGLKTKATQAQIKAYLEKIVFDTNKDKYTEESYQAYKEAYDRLVEISNHCDNVTKEEFFAACEGFEFAEKQLTLKQSIDGQVATGDHQDVKMPMMLASGAIIAIGLIGFVLYKKKKTKNRRIKK